MPAQLDLPDTDNFAAAFDRLADMTDTVSAPSTVAEDAPAPAVQDEVSSDVPVETAQTAEPDQLSDTPEEVAPLGTKASAPPEESAQDLMERLRTMLKTAAPEPAAAGVQETAPDTTPALFTAEEQETLSTYERDWPEIAAAEALRSRKMAHDIVSHIFAELAPVLRPVLDSTAALDTREYLSVLEARVPDYREIRDNVEAWALDTKHPMYLRDAYQRVIQEGTADEVVDLIARYRKEIGGTYAPAVAPKRAVESELPAATKKAVASLAPVSSKRSVVTGRPDPLDFDGAFSAFADDA